MGTDIHIVIMRRSADDENRFELEVVVKRVERNYTFFSCLAGVRGEPKPETDLVEPITSPHTHAGWPKAFWQPSDFVNINHNIRNCTPAEWMKAMIASEKTSRLCGAATYLVLDIAACIAARYNVNAEKDIRICFGFDS
jgi:hypothetical protein